MDNYYAVIMAGGGGTRLWPLSRKDRPKQFLKIIDDRSMFQIAIDRLTDIFNIDHIYVVTVASQVEGLHQEYPSLPRENFIIEPLPRGTASVVGLAAAYLKEKDPEAVMAVLTADHIIENVELFHQLLTDGYNYALKNHLVTLGIEPTYAATGYGYIHAGESLPAGQGMQVKQFVEKPDQDTAKKYLESGEYFWNSGMFIWHTNVIMQEFKKQMPALNKKLVDISGHLQQGDADTFIPKIWQTIQPQTIDYGIMEHAQDVVVLPAKGLGWSDVGSWDSLFEILSSDENGNISNSDDIIRIDSNNTLYQSEINGKLIALIGIEDLVIIDSGKALLICKKGQTQRVKEVVSQIKDQNKDTYL